MQTKMLTYTDLSVYVDKQQKIYKTFTTDKINEQKLESFELELRCRQTF